MVINMKNVYVEFNKLVESEDWFWDLERDRLELVPVCNIKVGDIVLYERREFKVTGVESRNLPSGFVIKLNLSFTGNGANSAGIDSILCRSLNADVTRINGV